MTAQLVHEEAPVALKVPAAHCKQAAELVAPSVLLYVPAEQALQDAAAVENCTVAIMPYPVTLPSDDQEIVREFEVVVQEPSEPSAYPLTVASERELVLAPLYKRRLSQPDSVSM